MLALEIMTPHPRTIRTDGSIQEAIEALHAMEVRHLPVVDEQGQLVGMLSDRDLRSAWMFASDGDIGDDLLVARQRGRVAQLMSAGVASVDTDTELDSVIEQMIEQKVGAVPVVDGEGRPVGIVSYIDILRVLADNAALLEPPQATSAEREEIP